MTSDAEPAERAPGARTLGRNLPVAIVSGVILAALFFGTLRVGPYAFLGFVAVLVLVALFELDQAVRTRGLRPATPIAAGAGMVAFFGTYEHGPPAQALALVLLLFGMLAWALLDPGFRARSEGPERVAATAAANLGVTCLMMMWVPFLASYIGLLLARQDGHWQLIAVIALAVASDVGAFGFGSRFGRTPMAPRVSPKKTWEGFAGAVVTVLVVSALVMTRLVPGLDLAGALLFGLVVVGASTLGDLAESLVKRDLGVKDMGRIIPGHGGIMDRVDAIIFALPAGYLVLSALGV